MTLPKVVAVVLILASVASSGCLLPAPYEPASSDENRWPTLVPVYPAPTSPPLQMDPACASYRFSATVEDPDPDDTIYWRVFIDYFRPDNRPLARDPEIQTLTDTSEEPAVIDHRVVPIDLPGSVPVNPLLNPHYVEIFISDRPFLPETEPQGRAVEEGGLTDNFVWTVELSELANCEVEQ